MPSKKTHIRNTTAPRKRVPRKQDVHRMINAQLQKLRELQDSEDYDWSEDWTTNAPKNASLMLKDVQALKAGARRFLYVIEPQSYERVTKLTPDNYMIAEDLGGGWRDTCGLFADDGDGRAVSGSGDDLWLVPTPTLLKYLRKLTA